MKHALVIAAILCAATSRGGETAQPNVLLIYADDLGQGVLGYCGQKDIKTPHIDRLAEQGMRFSHFYGCEVCAPARASLLTGRTNAHAPVPNQGGLETRRQIGAITPAQFDADVNKPNRRMNTYFLGQMARDAGYTTAYFGKLGIGYTDTAQLIERYGFDYHCGLYDSVICWSYYPEYYWENGQKVPLKGNPKFTQRSPVCPSVGSTGMTNTEDVWLDKCLHYLEQKRDKPFFIIYATQLPHGPAAIVEKDFIYKDRTDWTEKERIFASMVAKLDASVGTLTGKLKELGLADNTVVIFTADNGHEIQTYVKPKATGFWDGHHRGEDRFNGTLGQRGIKRYNFEGGLNVPFLVRWPGHIKPNSATDRPTAVYDLMPTLAELIGGNIPVAIDGVSFLPTLLSRGEQKQHPYLFWINTTGATRDAIIADGWKLIEELDIAKSVFGPYKGNDAHDEMRTDPATTKRVYRWALYDLRNDPFEKTDLIDKHPDRADQLKRLIQKAKNPLPDSV